MDKYWIKNIHKKLVYNFYLGRRKEVARTRPPGESYAPDMMAQKRLQVSTVRAVKQS